MKGKSTAPYFFLFLLITLFPAASLHADHHIIPPSPLQAELEGRSALIIDLGRFDPYLELKGRLQGSPLSPGYASVTMGGYLRVLDNLKTGLFYRLQTGARHDDDWILEDGEWLWADTEGRLEHLLMFDVTPRFILPFLPGKNWVVSLKGRYIFNFFNLHHSVYLRPGVTYVFMSGRTPVVTASLNYGFYFPLNFSEAILYKHEPYLRFLFHLTGNVKIEATASFRTERWTTSRDALEIGEESYIVPNQSISIGAGILFTL